jgi:hypothetical protein
MMTTNDDPKTPASEKEPPRPKKSITNRMTLGKVEERERGRERERRISSEGARIERERKPRAKTEQSKFGGESWKRKAEKIHPSIHPSVVKKKKEKGNPRPMSGRRVKSNRFVSREKRERKKPQKQKGWARGKPPDFSLPPVPSKKRNHHPRRRKTSFKLHLLTPNPGPDADIETTDTDHNRWR